jgi:hypothetical protein
MAKQYPPDRLTDAELKAKGEALAAELRASGASIYEQAKALDVEMDSHESDLYMPVNDVTTALVKEYQFRSNVRVFRSNIAPHNLWYDVPFAYQPFWEGKRR